MVAMPSLHFFRWVDQLKDSGFEVFWFDVTGAGNFIDRISWVHQITDWKLRWDFPGRTFLKKKLPTIFEVIQRINERKVGSTFEKKFNDLKPDIVHSFALQHGCLPILDIMNKNKIPWIYSTWGSDIFNVIGKVNHEKKLSRVLQRTDYLFTDCYRDYKIAQKHQFQGKYLGVYPGGGGFDFGGARLVPYSQRKIILVKGYEGQLGKCINVLEALKTLKEFLASYKIIIFGANRIVLNYVKNDTFWREHAEVHEWLSHSTILKLMSETKIYIGNSLSDGIPNTLLEAIAFGAYPIQSNPGKATEEVLIDNFNGIILKKPEDIAAIANSIRAYFCLENIKEGIDHNLHFLRKNYEWEYVKTRVLSAYSKIL